MSRKRRHHVQATGSAERVSSHSGGGASVPAPQAQVVAPAPQGDRPRPFGHGRDHGNGQDQGKKAYPFAKSRRPDGAPAAGADGSAEGRPENFERQRATKRLEGVRNIRIGRVLVEWGIVANEQIANLLLAGGQVIVNGCPCRDAASLVDPFAVRSLGLKNGYCVERCTL